jgi:4-hydroxybenzoate polyprenyltransferase
MIDYFRLARIGFAPLTAVPFIVGGLAADLSPWTIVVLGLAGSMYHTYSCHINDLTDRVADEQNPARATSPLIAGTVTVERLTLWVAVEAAGLAAAACLLPENPLAKSGFLALILLTSWGNIFQKKSRRVSPLVTDLLFGVAVAAPLPLTVMAVGVRVTWPHLVVSAALALQMAVTSATTGNIKDLDADRAAGLQTTALRLSVSRRGDGTLAFTRSYASYVLTVQVGLVLCVAWLGLLPASAVETAVWAVAFLLCLGATVSLSRVLRSRTFPSQPGWHGMSGVTSAILADIAAIFLCYPMVVPGRPTVVATALMFAVPVLAGAVRRTRARWRSRRAASLPNTT